VTDPPVAVTFIVNLPGIAGRGLETITTSAMTVGEMRKRPGWSTAVLRPEGEDDANRLTAPVKPSNGTRSSLNKMMLPGPTSTAPPINGTKTECQVTTKFGEKGELVNVANCKVSERVARPTAKLTQAKTLLSLEQPP
jgi:hypothetical protein